ncbi:MAG TPA: DUF4760 domain-containing protein [Candidatus Bathyarchaeia archaeon]|nr:DUF4760 domain-containing protein [Candidatus Bathyarchaeia archaeon]
MPNLVTVLSEVSSIAVIAGVVLILFQLKQNAKETRATAAFALLEKLTDESYVRRRKRMHDTLKKYGAKNWKGFDDTLQDWETRNFAYLYELIGQLVQQRIIDLDTVTEALKYVVVIDWEAVSPLANHIMERYKVKVHHFQNFEWLAMQARNSLGEEWKNYFDNTS